MDDTTKVVELSEFDQRLMVNGLVNFRNNLLEEDKPVDDVNDLIVRIIDAPTKRARWRREYDVR